MHLCTSIINTHTSLVLVGYHAYVSTKNKLPIGMCYVYCIRNSSWVLWRSLSTGSYMQAGKSWRISQGESQSGRDYGPLVDLPDWKYADGRPAPLGSGQLKRQQEQRQIAERIDRLASEMTAAIQTTQNKEKARQRKQDQINQHKLKVKGHEFRKHKLSSKDSV